METANDFCKRKGKIGVGCIRSQSIPMEVVTESSDIKTEKTSILKKWKTDFGNLQNKGDNEELYNSFNSCLHINSHEK